MTKLSQKILTWFDKNKRTHLPWRRDPSPYKVWVSEIMLQQTRVETVIPYFNRFMETLPRVKDLAECDEDQLLKLWEGLGYYSRARNLQKAAKEIMDRFDGQIPNSYEDLLSLPGIGPYTAGAIASIAFNQVQIAADGNAYRIVSRLLAYEGELEKTQTKKVFQDFLKEEISEDRPGDFNQALMDLGSLLCLANGRPLCDQCPIKDDCHANKQRNPQSYPKRKAKKKRKKEKKTILILERDKEILLVKRPRSGLLSGMWSLLSLDGELSEEELKERLVEEFDRDKWKLDVFNLGKEKHIFSHIEWHMEGFLIRFNKIGSESNFETDLNSNLEKPPLQPFAEVDLHQIDQLAEETLLYQAQSPYIWVNEKELLDKYSIPSAYKKYIEKLLAENS